MESLPRRHSGKPPLDPAKSEDLEDTARSKGRSFHGKPPTLEAPSAPSAIGPSRVLRDAHHPAVVHATGSRVVKGEDVLFIQPLAIESSPPCVMYMVCDGHSGLDAASFVATHFLRLLSQKLPAALPNFSDFQDVDTFAEDVRKAVCQTFFHLDNEWAAGGLHSGTTVTVCLVTGWLITVGNVGDSSCVLDTGSSILELTKSHRLQDCLEEQARLKAANCQLAPLGFHLQGAAKPGEIGVGPLRLWPGGLCVARSVGDLDAGPEVLPLPNIRQVIMPVKGCRLIMASDGLWDVVTLSKACTMTRMKNTGDASVALMQAVTRDLRMMDDTTIVVADLLPPDNVGGWPSVVLHSDAKGGKKGGGAGGLCACFRPDDEETDSRDVMGAGHLTYFADVDTLRAYPSLKGMLNRTLIFSHYAVPPTAGVGRDFTQHGAHTWRASLTAQGPGSGSHHSRFSGDASRHSAASPEAQLILSKVMSSPALSAMDSVDGRDGGSRRGAGSGAGRQRGGESLYGSAAHGGSAAAAALKLHRVPSGVSLAVRAGGPGASSGGVAAAGTALSAAGGGGGGSAVDPGQTSTRRTSTLVVLDVESDLAIDVLVVGERGPGGRQTSLGGNEMSGGWGRNPARSL